MGFDDWLRALPVHPEVAEAFANIANSVNEQGYDPWGFNPEIAERLFTISRAVANYFRPLVSGIENIPEGRVLIVANHSGQLPFDGVVAASSVLLHGKPPRVVRAMAERWFPTIPFVNELFVRSGVVVGDPTNCRNLLEADNAILVFPEGARGCGKTYDHRYKLVRFGRGFMRLALETGTPIVPLSIIGAEESIPSMFNLKRLAKLVGAPYIPVPPHFLLLGPLSWVPLPTQFHLHFGEPLRFEGPHDDRDEAIDERVASVTTTLQGMIDEGLAQRTSVF